MKESKSLNMTSVEEGEKFHADFISMQEDIERRILCAESLPLEEVKNHFSKLNSSLLELQKLYSASSPYLRIYHRKVHQDALNDLQTKLIESEEKLLPRKKFAFKGKIAKEKPTSAKIEATDNVKIVSKPISAMAEWTGDCSITDSVDLVINLTSTVATGKSVVLSKLKGCTVHITASPNTVHISDVQDCTICVGPTATSVFVHAALSSTFHIACQQLRIHETQDTDFFVHVTSKAIIEDCQRVRFGGYTFSYPALEEDYKLSGLNRDVNNWRNIDDFNWLVAGQPSPNWSNIEDVNS